MSTSGQEWDISDPAESEWREDRRALSPAGIAAQNDHLLRQYREFLRAADAVAAAWRNHRAVLAVALIGSLARPPWKEVPRFRPYRRAGIRLWHECKDVDLAIWLTCLDDLNGLRRMKDRALRTLFEQERLGVANHQIDTFIFEPVTNRYLGRLCGFNQCPRGKAECRAPGCGATKFLRQFEDFRWQPESLAEGRAVRLFDRATGETARAADLPLPKADGGTDAEADA